MAPQMLQVGSVRTYLISDGIFWTDGGAAFGIVPRALWEKVITPDSLNRIPMQLRCWLIESSEGLILVDTGYGDKLPAKMCQFLSLEGDKRLHGELAQSGYRPEDVDIVINTHLHGDHCGGNTSLTGDGELLPTFPNATYMMQRLELADATYPNERTRNTYFSENFLPLTSLCLEQPVANQRATSHTGREGSLRAVRVLTGDTQVTQEVRTLITPGHTRAHQVVIVESRGETAMFLADVAGWAANFERLAWVPAFDVEPLVSMETKRSLRDWAQRRDAMLLFQHDITMAAGRVHHEGEQWHVEPAG